MNRPTSHRLPPAPAREQGYAILFIFLMAAMIGIALYTAAPRVAFESQRDREQLLVDRGEQYKRAIQLYFRKLRKYPAKLEDLDNTSGQRFLRQKYVDPMTGKNEWRLVHVGPGGVFTDSLTQKNNGAKKQDPASVNNFITELKPISGSDTAAAQGVNVALRKRPSDQGGAGEGVDHAFATGETGGEQAPETMNPGGAIAGNGSPSNGNPGNLTPGTVEQEGREFENSLPPNETPAAAANNNGGYPNPTGFGQTVTPTNPQGTGTPNIAPNGPGAFPGAFGGRNRIPGQPPNGPDLIRNILTSPRPGGPPPGIGGSDNSAGGFPSSQSPTAVTGGTRSTFGGSASNTGGFNNSGTGNPGTTVGGGIAGVASLAERPGIKIYADHKKYNEWEFIYDFGKDPMYGGQGGQGGQTRNPQQQQTGFGQNTKSTAP